MSESVNVAATIAPKSDQLNADDLIAGPITVRIVSVTKGNAESPIRVNIEGRLPYYPCKSMRRVLVAAWGSSGDDYAGRYITLYRDPEVKYGGIKVGGIRISHLSHIEADMYMALTITRGKRAEYVVRVLPAYPAAMFAENLPKMREAIASKKSTPESVIAYCEKTGYLTDEQKQQITKPKEQF